MCTVCMILSHNVVFHVYVATSSLYILCFALYTHQSKGKLTIIKSAHYSSGNAIATRCDPESLECIRCLLTPSDDRLAVASLVKWQSSISKGIAQ